MSFKKMLSVLALVLVPTAALAQGASLAGVVKDTSGAVMPGVTVEASSDVLIEKTRSAVTDGTGQYRIVDLRPGMYVLTFTLTGFNNVRREAVEVTGAGVVTIDAELRVGSVSETVTVTGETPIVDVQSTRRVTTLDSATVSAIPVARGYGNLLATVPGIQIFGAGGTTTSTGLAFSFFTSNGGRSNEGRVQIAGMNVGSAFGGGGVAAFGYPVAESQEVQVTVSGGLGEADIGGPAMNLIPREGGNRFAGRVFGSEAGSWSQGDNLTDELRAPPISITQPAGLVRNWDESFSLGGPVVRDRLWFYGVIRDYGTMSHVLGAPTTYGNLNAGKPNAWIWAPDTGTELRTATSARQGEIRFTGQVTPRNKLGFYHSYVKDCWSSALVKDQGCRPRGDNWVALGSQSASPETGTGWDDREKIIQITYSSPVTSKLLVEGGYSTFISQFGGFPVAGALLDYIPVTEQSNYYGIANFAYRGVGSGILNGYSHNKQMPNVWIGSVSYVTGAHSLKIGTQGAYHISAQYGDTTGTPQIGYTFNSLCALPAGAAAGTACTLANGGILTPRPISVTTVIPNFTDDRSTFQAYYVQDQWTHDRLTLQGALRYEWAKSFAPEGENGVFANRWTPALLDPTTQGVTGYHNLSPRVGLAYDVFGNGKTAVRVNLGHYLQSVNNEANYVINNPSNGRQRTQTRNWTDVNGNFIVDCNLSPTSIAAQTVPGGDICGPVTGASLNFGSVVRTRTVNPDVLHGWGIRPYDWVFGASIQQEVIPRLSVEFAYNRRTWGNFFVDDNLNLGVGDYDLVTITAPQNENLTNGGGYPVSFRVPRVSAATRNYYTFASDYGNQTALYSSFQATVRARTRWGLTLQGGTTTGRGVRDNCEIEAKLPELTITGPTLTTSSRVDACHVTEDWLTSLNGLFSYTVPKVDVLVSTIMRSQPGTQPGGNPGSGGGSLAANYNVTNLQVFNSVGRNLVACAAGTAPAACTSTQTVNLLLPGEVYQKRLNSFDMRFAKIFRFGGKRADVGIDLYNIINANTQTGYNTTYGNDGTGLWRPTSIQQARFARFNVTFDF